MTIQLKELQLYLHYYVRKYMRHHLPKIIKLIRLLVCVPLWLNLRSIVIILISGQLSLLFFYQIGFFLNFCSNFNNDHNNNNKVYQTDSRIVGICQKEYLRKIITAIVFSRRYYRDDAQI